MQKRMAGITYGVLDTLRPVIQYHDLPFGVEAEQGQHLQPDEPVRSADDQEAGAQGGNSVEWHGAQGGIRNKRRGLNIEERCDPKDREGPVRPELRPLLTPPGVLVHMKK